ncbi:hypothetical protein V6N13_021559 [Hibiscus sabdariffa]
MALSNALHSDDDIEAGRVTSVSLKLKGGFRVPVTGMPENPEETRAENGGEMPLMRVLNPIPAICSDQKVKFRAKQGGTRELLLVGFGDIGFVGMAKWPNVKNLEFYPILLFVHCFIYS